MRCHEARDSAAAQNYHLATQELSPASFSRTASGGHLVPAALGGGLVGLVIGPCPVPSRRRGRRPRHQAAAAAFGGYLRALALVDVPARVTILQGADMGRPSRLLVDLAARDERVQVTGTANPIPHAGVCIRHRL
jgi:hypothetical protein